MNFYYFLDCIKQAFVELVLHPLFFSFPLFIELSYYLLVLVGLVRYVIRHMLYTEPEKPYRPAVSCLVTCYSEGEAIVQTLHTLCEQTYEGIIEIIPVIDGALQNQATYLAAKRFIHQYESTYHPKRKIIIVPKWQRGGRVSSLNTGLLLSHGEIVMALDGDTSFDNDMVQKAIRHFADPKVAAVSGALVVRNAKRSLVTSMQAIEYQLVLLLTKIGLSEFNVINNISGAFGIFRRSMLMTVGGWNTGSAEDLDLTLRIKQYSVRYKQKIVFEPLAVGHTDVPETWKQFLMQRVRWDGDLIYIYMRKHTHSFNPRLIGWRNFIVMIWGGLLFQLVSPFVIIAYLLYSAFIMPFQDFLVINILVYLYYIGITCTLYSYYLIVSSQRPLRDITSFMMLPVFVCFTFISRLWSVVAILNELWRRGHEETSMAPWWVLKKTVKF